MENYLDFDRDLCNALSLVASFIILSFSFFSIISFADLYPLFSLPRIIIAVCPTDNIFMCCFLAFFPSSPFSIV